MQSSFKIIKSDRVTSSGNKEISTYFDNYIKNTIETDEFGEESQIQVEEQIEDLLQRAQAKADSIIENALSRSAETILKANSDALETEKNAYEKGYSEGSERGYQEAFENTTAKGQLEAQRLIQNANEILLRAKDEYEAYLNEKKDELIRLSVQMAETILKRELELPHGLNACLAEVLQNSRNMSSCIIRANEVHCSSIESCVQDWKASNTLQCEVFVIPDSELGPHDAVVEKNNGRIEIGLNAGLSGILNALM